ncbi:synergin gamma-like [Antedon mediterranea]|uniref:synergin gamma-like n=1 Tax=Antedon mediterranea TaxID=105859 RepID=UPI003AF5302E
MSFNNRNPQVPNPGTMNRLPGQQQLTPGQMQQGMMGVMPNQQFPMMQQGMIPGQMYHQQMYARQMNPQNFQGMPGPGQQQAYNMQMQGYMMQRVPFQGSPHEQEEMKKKMEKDKKDRQFQEQQRRLKSMEKPGVRSGVNPLDDLIGRQLGQDSRKHPPGVNMPGSYMQGGNYMQQLPQANRPGMQQMGMYQTQTIQSQHLGIQQQQQYMATQMQSFQGMVAPGQQSQSMMASQMMSNQPSQGMMPNQIPVTANQQPQGMMPTQNPVSAGQQSQGMMSSQMMSNQPSQGMMPNQIPVSANQQPQGMIQGMMPNQISATSKQPQGMINQAGMNVLQPQNTLQPAPDNSAVSNDFGDFHQGPTMASQPANNKVTSFSTEITTHVTTSQPHVVQSSDSDFGSFHQVPVKSTDEVAVQKESPEEPAPVLEESFGEFEKGPQVQTVTQEDVANTKEPGALSLEEMMSKSTNLSAAAPKTSRKMFNQKKSLNEVKTSTSKTQKVFNDSTKARVWSGSDSLAGMFAGKSKGTIEGSIATAEENIQQQEVSSNVDKEFPNWCYNEASLPLVYHQVLEATWNGTEVQTDKLRPILMCSNLDNMTLGHIWSLVNNTKPGQLTKQEIYTALALIALAQNRVTPLTIEMLNNFREAPVPQLVPKQNASENSKQRLSANVVKDTNDDFTPFQEAPKQVQASTHPNLSQPMQFPSFENQNVMMPTSSSSNIVPHPPASTTNDVLSDDLEMVSYFDQGMKSYNFLESKSCNSSCHSSPITSSHDTALDKLWKPACGESSSPSTDEDFTEFQSGSGSLSLEDRKNDFDDFSEISSKKESNMVSSSYDNKLPTVKPTGKSPGKSTRKSNTKPNFNINFDAYKKNDKKGTKKMPSSASVPKLTKLGEVLPISGSQNQKEKKEDFAEFQAFSSANNVTNSIQSSKKSESVNDFGNFQQSSGFADFQSVKHSASDTNLMALGDVDKYSALRTIMADSSDKNNSEELLQTNFDSVSQASSSGVPGSSGGQPPMLNLFGDESQPASDNQNDDDGFADFQHFPTTNSSSDVFANFQTAPSNIDKSDVFPAFQNNPGIPTNVDNFGEFKSSTAPSELNKVDNVQNTASIPDDDFANFQSAPADINSKKTENKYDVFKSFQADTPSLFKNSEDTIPSTNDDQSNINFNSFKSVNPISSEQSSNGFKNKMNTGVEDDEDDFGDFTFNEPPPLDDHNFGGTSVEDDHFGGFESSVADYYGVEFDSIDDLPKSTNQQTKNTNYFGTYHADKSKKSLGKLESIANLDLKSFDLDLNLGGKTSEEAKVQDDSFGEFSSVPPDNNQALTSTVTHSQDAVSQMVGSTPAFGGDRYAMLAGDIQDDTRHAVLWKRCLTSCLKVIQQANDTLNNISSSSVCNEVIKSVDGAEYLKGVIEIYRVACRVSTSVEAAGVGTEELNLMRKNIELVWNNLSAFLASASILPEDKSFLFKTALLHPEPSNINMACGVCLLNVDAKVKSLDCSEDSHKLMYGGRQYHTTCANLWVNLVDSILPALPFNQLL